MVTNSLLKRDQGFEQGFRTLAGLSQSLGILTSNERSVQDPEVKADEAYGRHDVSLGF